MSSAAFSASAALDSYGITNQCMYIFERLHVCICVIVLFVDHVGDDVADAVAPDHPAGAHLRGSLRRKQHQQTRLTTSKHFTLLHLFAFETTRGLSSQTMQNQTTEDEVIQLA